jgi:hypothetical protein
MSIGPRSKVGDLASGRRSGCDWDHKLRTTTGAQTLVPSSGFVVGSKSLSDAAAVRLPPRWQNGRDVAALIEKAAGHRVPGSSQLSSVGNRHLTLAHEGDQNGSAGPGPLGRWLTGPRRSNVAPQERDGFTVESHDGAQFMPRLDCVTTGNSSRSS